MTKRKRNTPAAPVGSDYVAVVRLSTKDNRTVALPGEGCDNVPVVSLGWLLASGKIKKAPVVTLDMEAKNG